HQGGHEVALLARGRRLADLRDYGVVLEDVVTGERIAARVDVVEALGPDDAYDLVMVIMRKNHALDILPALAANRHTPNVLFLMNNGAGPDALVEALGRERVLIGFPSSAGARDGHVIRVLTGSEDDAAEIPFGEVDGRVTGRTRAIARVIDSAPGFKAQIRTDMDAWLRTHVALLMPALVPALYMCDTDIYRMARTRDAVVLAVRGVREAFRVLEAAGIPITPAKYRLFKWVPEPLLVWGVRRLLVNPLMETAMEAHARAARDEMRHLADEFRALARTTEAPTPVIDRLYPYFDPATPCIEEGRQDIPLHWGGVILGGVAVVLALAGIGAALRGLVKGDRA
ncbi:MAG: alpha/beta hydrolase, partial [Anaerolineae bacterium]|nr:alpha/beta hydrolase [Anaerolineae bacterium]